MKTIRLILLLAGLIGLASFARAADVSVKGILISASNEKGESDPRLAPYAGNLRRILHAESLRFLGEDSTSLAVPASGHVSPGGEGVQLASESADGRTVLLKAQWGSARQEFVVQRGGSTTLLIGPSGKNGEVKAVLLIAK